MAESAPDRAERLVEAIFSGDGDGTPLTRLHLRDRGWARDPMRNLIEREIAAAERDTLERCAQAIERDAEGWRKAGGVIEKQGRDPVRAWDIAFALVGAAHTLRHLGGKEEADAT